MGRKEKGQCRQGEVARRPSFVICPVTEKMPEQTGIMMTSSMQGLKGEDSILYGHTSEHRISHFKGS
jgi:hypothetical protein